MNKPILFAFLALFLASGAAVAGDHGDHWGEHHHHRHHHHHHHGHHHRDYYQPNYGYYYYNPAPPPVYYAPQYYAPGYNAYIQSPDYGVRFGFSGTWSDR